MLHEMLHGTSIRKLWRREAHGPRTFGRTGLLSADADIQPDGEPPPPGTSSVAWKNLGVDRLAADLVVRHERASTSRKYVVLKVQHRHTAQGGQRHVGD